MDERKDAPTHDLLEIQYLCRLRLQRITLEASRTAQEQLGFDEEDIIGCVLKLRPENFYKSMPSEAMPGRWQDVYRITYSGKQVYLKIDLQPAQAWIVSFKEDDRT